MKKIYYILLIVPVLLLSGCSGLDDRVFDTSSAQRVNALATAAFDALTASEEGWYFEYYPESEEAKNRGGYWFWCKFNDNYTVQAATEFDVSADYPIGTVCESEFDIIKSRGAVLTFNIYNEILHYWAEPNEDLPNGYGGDHEFTICEVSSDYVKVKGIKSEKYMHFYKKKGGTVAEQMQDFYNIGRKIVAPAFEAIVAGAESASVSRSNRTFSLTYKYDTGKIDKDSAPIKETETVKMAFVPNMEGTGIKLYEPVKIQGKEISGFTYDEDNLRLVSDDGNNTVILMQIYPPMNELLPTFTWMFFPGSDMSSPSLISAFNTAAANVAAAGYGLEDEAYIGRGLFDDFPEPSIYLVLFAGGSYYGVQYYYTFTPVDGTEDEISLTLTGNGFNGSSIRTRVEALLNLFTDKSPYIITTDSIISPSYVTLTSKADSGFYFTAYL